MIYIYVPTTAMLRVTGGDFGVPNRSASADSWCTRWTRNLNHRAAGDYRLRLFYLSLFNIFRFRKIAAD